MSKAKASLLTKLRKKPKLGKSKNKIARKGKAEKKTAKNSLKTAGRKKRGFTEGSASTTSRAARSNSRSARKKNMTTNITPFRNVRNWRLRHWMMRR